MVAIRTNSGETRGLKAERSSAVESAFTAVTPPNSLGRPRPRPPERPPGPQGARAHLRAAPVCMGFTFTTPLCVAQAFLLTGLSFALLTAKRLRDCLHLVSLHLTWLLLRIFIRISVTQPVLVIQRLVLYSTWHHRRIHSACRQERQ